jgi:dual specificity phosphatase 12
MNSFIYNLFHFANESLKNFNLNDILYDGASTIDYIVDNIYLGDWRAAENLDTLKQHGITHIINCAAFLPEKYQTEFEYLSLHLNDDHKQNLSDAIKLSNDYIKKINDSKTNTEAKIFVHCIKGKSRSASIVIAYLMINKNMGYKEALQFVVNKRAIAKPNKFFEEQLISLESDKSSQ